MTLLNALLRVVLGGTFVSAGVLKIVDPAAFASAVANYRLVPHELINIVAILLPWLELVTGLCVLSGVLLRPAALLLMLVTGTFLLAVSTALARGLNIECGCFGGIDGSRIGIRTLAINFALFCIAATFTLRSGLLSARPSSN